MRYLHTILIQKQTNKPIDCIFIKIALKNKMLKINKLHYFFLPKKQHIGNLQVSTG